jgi:hypothetical protein
MRLDASRASNSFAAWTLSLLHIRLLSLNGGGALRRTSLSCFRLNGDASSWMKVRSNVLSQWFRVEPLTSQPSKRLTRDASMISALPIMGVQEALPK